MTARDLAAQHIQDEWRNRVYLREGAAAALQSVMRGSMARREVGNVHEHRAATALNAAWRGHLSRQYVASLRKQKAKSSTVRRSFSFSSKKKKKEPSTPAAPAAAEADDPFASMHARATPTDKKASLATKVRRSLSFDRKASSSSGSDSVSSIAASRRTFVLERGPQGLGMAPGLTHCVHLARRHCTCVHSSQCCAVCATGMELDATNTVVTIKPGGRAERQGLMALGDTILSIDGKSCGGLLMQVRALATPRRGAWLFRLRSHRASTAPALTVSPPPPHLPCMAGHYGPREVGLRRRGVTPTGSGVHTAEQGGRADQALALIRLEKGRRRAALVFV